MTSTNKQPLKGITLTNQKLVTKQHGKEVYELIIGRATVINTLFYVTLLNGKIMDSRNKFNKEDKQWWGI